MSAASATPTLPGTGISPLNKLDAAITTSTARRFNCTPSEASTSHKAHADTNRAARFVENNASARVGLSRRTSYAPCTERQALRTRTLSGLSGFRWQVENEHGRGGRESKA